MKKLLLVLILGCVATVSLAQNIDKITSVNGIELGVDQASFGGNLYLITGDEPAYKEAQAFNMPLKGKLWQALGMLRTRATITGSLVILKLQILPCNFLMVNCLKHNGPSGTEMS